MDTTPIRIPRERSPKTWQVRLPTLEKSERELKDSYEAYEELLRAYGFEKVHAVRSLTHSSLEYSSARRPEDWAIWHHPAGLIGFSHSSTWGGYPKSDGTVEPVQKKLGSFSVSTRIDMGTGSELQHRAAVGIRGGGSVDLQLDGRNVRSVSDRVHSNTSELKDFLGQVQRFGRFLPIDQWESPTIRESLYIPMEHLVPLEALPGGQRMKAAELYATVDMEEKWEAFLSSLPSSVQPLFRSQRASDLREEAEREAEKKNPGSRRKGLLWDPVELSLKHYSEALFFAKKRWAGSYDSELLTHWSYVALGQRGGDIANWRAFEKGPAGLNLPMVLIYGKRTAPMADQVLRLLDEAPLDVLRRWATEPDAAGYTLGLHAINRVFVEWHLSNHQPKVDVVLGVLEKLYERLGPEGLPMATAHRSVMGLALQFTPNGGSADGNHHVAQEAFSRIALRLEEWGLPWDQHLRWRNYPNLFSKEEGQPTFFRKDGPVAFEDWKALLGERATIGLKPLEALMRHKGLERSLEDEPTSVARRPRM